jgi:hypothetical protein
MTDRSEQAMTTEINTDEQPWYAVRSVFASTSGLDDSTRHYEERITIWQVANFDEAMERAEAEAEEYVEGTDKDYLVDFGQAFHLFDAPVNGAEVFSLIRDSELAPEQYLSTFFNTGEERQR